MASVLKKYVKELPESLLTDRLLPEFQVRRARGGGVLLWRRLTRAREQKVKDVPLEERAVRVAELVDMLPPVNHETCRLLFDHWHRVASRSSVTKMDGTNLALCMFPSALQAFAVAADEYDTVFAVGAAAGGGGEATADA